MNVRRQHRLRNDPRALTLDDKVARLERILGQLIKQVNIHTESWEHQEEFNHHFVDFTRDTPPPHMKSGYDFAFDTIEKDHKELENRITELEDKSEIIEELLEVQLG